jgi:E3 ubiquitin-protein ligase RNF13/E3 ubiquitin-protein ligase RNF167
MACRLLFLTTLLAFLAQIHSHPIDFLSRITSTAKSERNWLWSWAWGWGESTVSIVDRSPPLTFASRPAAFGAELTEPLLGYVIPLSSFTAPCEGDGLRADIPPNLGCPKLCVIGPNEPERTETWIALVQRGECQFVDKIREAQRLGANAVVVGGDDPDLSGFPDSLVNMYSPGMSI